MIHTQRGGAHAGADTTRWATSGYGCHKRTFHLTACTTVQIRLLNLLTIPCLARNRDLSVHTPGSQYRVRARHAARSTRRVEATKTGKTDDGLLVAGMSGSTLPLP